MCARLLSCPLCSQPGFMTLDALRAGLVSVATRPLTCPICNDTLLGIDKLTIHLFGHTINTNSNRTESNKTTDSKYNNSVLEVSHNGGMITPQNWNSQGVQIILSDRSQTGGINCDNSFAPLANLNSGQSVRTVAINTDMNSQDCGGLSRTSISEKSHDRIVFIRKTNQQQFCPLYEAESRSMQNITNSEVRTRNANPIEFHSSEDDARIASVPLKICQQNATQSSRVVEMAVNQREAVQENLKDSDNARKEESIEQFSWIENLLQENSAKMSESRVCASGEKNRSASVEEISSLSNGDTNISKYEVGTLNHIVTKDPIDGQENSLVLSESNIQRNEETANEDRRSSPNSNKLLPKWKAFQLLAMKEKMERCNVCGTHFPDRNFLILHKQLAHMIADEDVDETPDESLKNSPCHLCTKVFKTRGTLMVHMRVAHMGYNLGFLSKDREGEIPRCENGFNCPTCGKNFKKEQHVTQHLKTHEGKQWECDVCSKMFTTKYFLKKHKRLHSGEMPYKCGICDKTFTFQQSYHKHRLYHKDDKPHTCATCGRSFKELSTLHNHERIHTGEKPFACETCGKCFRQRVSYLVHRRIHTGVMPYKCTACGKSFRYKVSQRTHKCQAQPEDFSPPIVAESSATGCPQPNSHPLTTPDESILFKNQVPSEDFPSENNKFIFIVNTHGQPILTREADARTNDFLTERQISDSQCQVEIDEENRAGENNLWNDHGLSTENAAEECSANSPNRRGTLNEKMRTPETNDFFSLVMSPLENDLSSPSTEMEHLRLESPGNEKARQNVIHEVCETTGTNSLQRDLNNAIDGIFRENRSGNSPLETINEESLKQLLYGIDRKNVE